MGSPPSIAVLPPVPAPAPPVPVAPPSGLAFDPPAPVALPPEPALDPPVPAALASDRAPPEPAAPPEPVVDPPVPPPEPALDPPAPVALPPEPAFDPPATTSPPPDLLPLLSDPQPSGARPIATAREKEQPTCVMAGCRVPFFIHGRFPETTCVIGMRAGRRRSVGPYASSHRSAGDHVGIFQATSRSGDGPRGMQLAPEEVREAPEHAGSGRPAPRLRAVADRDVGDDG